MVRLTCLTIWLWVSYDKPLKNQQTKISLRFHNHPQATLPALSARKNNKHIPRFTISYRTKNNYKKNCSCLAYKNQNYKQLFESDNERNALQMVIFKMLLPIDIWTVIAIPQIKGTVTYYKLRLTLSLLDRYWLYATWTYHFDYSFW